MMSSSTAQRFSLTWNDYKASLVSAFESLRGEGEFVDVTLGCEGQTFFAHKMLLSACSPFFRSLLRNNPCQHPIILVRETNANDLRAILEFMYNGEVSIEEDQLDSFLKSSAALQIRGLTESGDQGQMMNSFGNYPPSVPMTHGYIPMHPHGVPIARHAESPLQPLAQPGPASAAAASAPAAAAKETSSSPASTKPSSPKPESPPPPPTSVGRRGRKKNTSTPTPTTTPTPPSIVSPSVNTRSKRSAENASLERESRSKMVKNENEDSNYSDQTTDPQEFLQQQQQEDEQYGEEEEEGSFRDGDETNGHRFTGHVDESFDGDTSGNGGDQPTCKICGKVFQSRNARIDHIKVHRGMTQCPICGKVFSTLGNMKRHREKVHPSQE